MKTKYIYFLAFILVLLSCEDKKDPVLNMNDLIPQVITAPADESNFIITDGNLDSTLTITWNKAEYGLSISGVTYIVMLDHESNNFEDAENLTSTTDLSASIDFNKLNTIVKGFGVEEAISTPLKIKVTSHISDQLEQTSEIVNFNVTPYFKPVVIPVPDTVYLLGDATTVGWDNTAALNVISDGTSSIYTITTELGDGTMKILKQLGAWAPQWGTNETGTSTGGPLIYRPDEATTDPPGIPSPGVGTYKIDVDLDNLTYTITPV